MTVNQILRGKGNDVFFVSSTITVYEAIKIMGEMSVGSVLIIENDELKGILTERDYTRKIALKGKSSKETLVSDIMDKDLITVKSSDDIHYCMELMIDKKVRHLPVLEDKKLLGIVSMGDILMSIIKIQKDTIDHLDSYITGKKA